ncbi:MAG: ABC transporter substrate-binding protein [bacterium]|nr:ABC transporter substrate-binding protein [bacterium]
MRNRFRKFSCAFLLLALGVLFPLSARVEESPAVAILLSGKQPAFQEVAAGFMETAREIRLFPFELGGTEESRGKVIKTLRSGATPAAIFAVGSQAAELAQKDFPEVPLVFSMVLNPEPFLGHPNTTGITMKIHPRDQLQAFKKILPRIRKIGVIYDPEQNRSTIAEAQAAAREIGLTLLEKRVSQTREIANAIKDLMYLVDAFWIIPDQTVISKESFQYFLETSIERKIPLFAFSGILVKGGALLALAPDYQDMGRQAGNLTKKILAGKSPQSLPPLSPEGHLVLNQHTAQALDLTIPPEILKTAEKTY